MDTLLVNNQMGITGLGRTTLKKKVHLFGLRQGKNSTRDIQTGTLVIQITQIIRTAFNTGPLAICYGMTSSVTNTKNTFASKYECTPLGVLISPSSTYRKTTKSMIIIMTYVFDFN